MSNLVPDPHDYFVLELAGDPSEEPGWAITQDGQIRRVCESQEFAIRIVRHFARMSQCRAWLMVTGAAPFLLTM